MLNFDDVDEPEVEELITWEEANWTREAMGLSLSAFARLLGVRYQVVYEGLKRPLTFLKPQTALMLRMGSNRARHHGKTYEAADVA